MKKTQGEASASLMAKMIPKEYSGDRASRGYKGTQSCKPPVLSPALPRSFQKTYPHSHGWCLGPGGGWDTQNGPLSS